MTAGQVDVARVLSTLEAERWGRVGGRNRFATIPFPNGSVALVPSSLSVAVWRGMRDAS